MQWSSIGMLTISQVSGIGKRHFLPMTLWPCQPIIPTWPFQHFAGLEWCPLISNSINSSTKCITHLSILFISIPAHLMFVIKYILARGCAHIISKLVYFDIRARNCFNHSPCSESNASVWRFPASHSVL